MSVRFETVNSLFGDPCLKETKCWYFAQQARVRICRYS